MERKLDEIEARIEEILKDATNLTEEEAKKIEADLAHMEKLRDDGLAKGR